MVGWTVWLHHHTDGAQDIWWTAATYGLPTYYLANGRWRGGGPVLGQDCVIPHVSGS